jgi:hypothetical protein
LEKPLEHVLGYDKQHKALWLESIYLACARYTNRSAFVASSMRQQREMMATWLGQIEELPQA